MKNAHKITVIAGAFRHSTLLEAMQEKVELPTISHISNGDW